MIEFNKRRMGELVEAPAICRIPDDLPETLMRVNRSTELTEDLDAASETLKRDGGKLVMLHLSPDRRVYQPGFIALAGAQAAEQARLMG